MILTREGRQLEQQDSWRTLLARVRSNFEKETRLFRQYRSGRRERDFIAKQQTDTY